MLTETVVNPETNENTYIVSADNEKGAVIIDPGEDAEKIAEILKKKGLEPKGIFLTHGHIDHISGAEGLRKTFGAEIWSSRETSVMLTDSVTNLSEMFGNRMSIGAAEHIVNHGDTVRLCGLEITALMTPGHTDGGTCWLIGGTLFSGDTLFLRSVGRTDFPTGDKMTLVNSVRNVLYKLPDETRVLCGHGAETSIGYEKKYNFYVNG